MAAKKKTKKKTAPKKSPPKRAPAKKKAPAKKAPAKRRAPAKKKALATKAPARKKALAKKAPAKAKAKAKRAAKKPITRRDATGHLNPKYARELLERSRESRDDGDDNRAFLKRSRSKDDLAEELGEEAVGAMTSGEDQSDRLEAEFPEERGGPFVRTGGRQEFARGTDKSNPRRSTREPFPKT